ncbi:unnamed protein product [Phytophthora fragariaefolia]|uniref:Unnamed protein product n=1 Tax=Phytophthora fragariaefolia TaxID=1490495 RepID=A0A9W7D1F2_9STRA|nr:unnamed protein product [Phytophthora fragariaefolia]
MARGQSLLTRAQARALSADTPPSAASSETSVSVMAPPAASPGVDGGSPSRPPLAGVAEASAPSSLPTVSTGDASGEGSESSVVQPDDALSPVLGAVSRSAADALEAAGSLSDVLTPVPRSPAPWKYELTELRGDVASLEARLAASDASLRREVDLRLRPSACATKLRTCATRPSRTFGGSGSTTLTLLGSSWPPPLRWNRAPKLPWSSSSGAVASTRTSSASTAAMPAGFATFLEELGALQLAIPPPPSASGSSEASVPAPPASSGTSGGATATSGSSTSLTVDSDTSDDSGPFAAIPSGSDPPFSPIPRTPASPASSTASSDSLPSTPVVSRGITPGTEASVPVEIDDDGSSGADGTASEASVAPGGVFSSPVVSQPRCDGRPTRAASTTAGLRSMAAAENEAAPDALVLGLATPPRTPAATQASVASSVSTPDPAESAAVVAGGDIGFGASSSGQHPHGPDSASSCGDDSDLSLPDLANPLLEPAFTIPGAQEAWCEILNARIPRHIASDRVTECSVADIQAFADCGKIKCPPEVLLEPSMLQYSFEILTCAPSSTREEVGAAIVVNSALMQSHITAPWVQGFSDARAQAVADAPAAAGSPSDASSARTPIPAVDQANVQAELGAAAPSSGAVVKLSERAATAITWRSPPSTPAVTSSISITLFSARAFAKISAGS